MGNLLFTKERETKKKIYAFFLKKKFYVDCFKRIQKEQLLTNKRLQEEVVALREELNKLSEQNKFHFENKKHLENVFVVEEKKLEAHISNLLKEQTKLKEEYYKNLSEQQEKTSQEISRNTSLSDELKSVREVSRKAQEINLKALTAKDIKLLLTSKELFDQKEECKILRETHEITLLENASLKQRLNDLLRKEGEVRLEQSELQPNCLLQKYRSLRSQKWTNLFVQYTETVPNFAKYINRVFEYSEQKVNKRIRAFHTELQRLLNLTEEAYISNLFVRSFVREYLLDNYRSLQMHFELGAVEGNTVLQYFEQTGQKDSALIPWTSFPDALKAEVKKGIFEVVEFFYFNAITGGPFSQVPRHERFREEFHEWFGENNETITSQIFPALKNQEGSILLKSLVI